LIGSGLLFGTDALAQDAAGVEHLGTDLLIAQNGIKHMSIRVSLR
jgi:hypothetical protein